ncbi:MAG: alanine--tRNA ligase [Ruminococcaceae bacterium]|nr:alanine--tRNA ligase [Oscillospiraceae bacterium]
MKWTSLNELREKYLSFFESKGHLRLGSYPLVPQNDKSLLLINSGMAPMKKFFTGEVVPPKNRVTTCQKCIRTPDLERVGHTARHGTYFEMLGNFSFGDYFKEEAIAWAWEFLTVTLEIPENLLWPSIYENDEEAYDIWTKKIGVDPNHVVRLGKADNFWEHGSGPCGPCSEIYFDRGEKYGCGSPDCKPGCDCDRYMEIWNNVFSQFNNDGNGNYTELKQKNIDTGMGLERLACVLQGVDNLFEVDTVRNILNKVCEIAGKTYGNDAKNDVSIRVVTDHLRGATFMICDGVLPSNEGRGYVLRRLLRRAARHGKLLGINRMFLCEICDQVIAENKDAYPELVEKSDMIKKIIAVEEENFGKTIDQGLKMLDEITASGDGKVLSGADAFKLNDTYGFPLDITKDILEEKGWTVDEDEFHRLMTEQKQRARDARKAADGESWKSNELTFDGVSATEFVGYSEDECEATVLDIVVDGEHVESAEDSKAVIVLDRTVLYAESGGQVGDEGELLLDTAKIAVNDVKKNASGIFMHYATVLDGTVSVGDRVVAKINTERRTAIRRNHTAAHLLQAGLRAVLGTHVEQAGQLVNESAVRFDFTHFQGLTSEELSAVEGFVNEAILAAIEVENKEMPIDEARAMGAMALFGEKYGDVVRVVNVPSKSVELCGGTHIDNTAKIGLFKIVSESSVASGVRRIEAVTGRGVLELIDKYIGEVNTAAAVLKLNNPSELAKKCEQISNELKAKDKEIEKLNSKLAALKVGELVASAVAVGSVKLITAKLENAGSETLRSMGDKIRDLDSSAVAVLADVKGDSVTFAATAGKDAQGAGVMSGKLVAAVAAIAGGKGGGRPDFAMAGAKDVSKVDEALTEALAIVQGMLK